MGRASLLVGGVAVLLFLQCASTFKLVCYFTTWTQYRESSARFIPDDIDPGLCTHIIYAFAKIEENRITHTESNDVTTYMNIHALKRRNPSLKTLISLGGYGPGSEAYRYVTTDPTKRLVFVRSVVQFLRTHKFDGFDLAWHSSDQTSKRRLSDLVQDLSIAFQREARRNPGTAKPILSVAISAGKEVIDNGFDIQHISKFADFFNFMTYDFHGYSEGHRYTGHVSPLHKGRVDTGASSSYNVDEAVKYFKTKGAPSEKIIMGVPTYGRSFTLSSMLAAVGAPASGPGTPGPFTKTEGFLAYYEICSFNYGAKTERIEEQAVPYSHKGNQWVGYEDKISLQTKVRYMKNNHLGGIMVWTLDMDDFSGFFCRDGKYPLLRAIKEELNK